MVKVQHGWQSRNINELEDLASNQFSPTSGSSGPRQPYAIPGPANQSASHTQLSRSSIPASEIMGDVNDARQSPHIGAAYDSFWREHEGSSAATAKQAQNLPAGGPSLAPPVDILPRNQRRLDFIAQQPPALRTNNLYNPRTQLLPKTPSPKKPSKMRTPSQQAAVEKEAVESLLFMSSPGNSGYHASSTLSGTPLRSEFAPQTIHEPRPKVVDHYMNRNELSMLSPALHQQQPTLRRPLSGADIDKLLDAMPDSSSSDEADPRNSRPQHRNPGR